jgi:hypothetical protein
MVNPKISNPPTLKPYKCDVDSYNVIHLVNAESKKMQKILL